MKVTEFKSGFEELCQRYSVKPTTMLTQVYCKNLLNLTKEQFIEAIEIAFSVDDFLPSPKKLLEYVLGDPMPGNFQLLELAGSRLAEIRYDQKYRLKKEDIMSELPSQLSNFVKESKLDLLTLTEMDNFSINKLRKDLKNYLDRQLPANNYLALNNVDNYLLGGESEKINN